MNASEKIKAVITGTTGMVGEGVLHECLIHPQVEKVLVINRRPCGISHPKLEEIIHPDFFDLSPIASQLRGYNAAFLCLGISTIGVSNDVYYKMTYTLTAHVAETLSRMNMDMISCYISGIGTDSSEKGWSAWARVKGKTENALMKMPFAHAYAFRPGYIHPTPGLQRVKKYYDYISWMYPLLRRLTPNSVNTLREVGLAMINITLYGYDKKIITPRDIRKLSER